MSKTVKNLEKYDIRVIQRYLREGIIDRKDYDAWLAALPDEAALAVETATRFSANTSEPREKD